MTPRLTGAEASLTGKGGMQPPFIEKGSGHALKKGSQERQKMVFLLQRLPAIEQNTV